MSSLTVRRHDGAKIGTTHNNGFIVEVPSRIAEGVIDAIAATEIELWSERDRFRLLRPEA
jgi:hypothetical protein